MARKWFLVVACLALVFAIAVPTTFSQFEFPQPGGATSGEEINFGDVLVGQTQTAQYTFTVLATSQTSAQVTIYAPCSPFGFSGLASQSMVLQPGQSITFGVTFTPPQAQAYTCNFVIRAAGGYPVQQTETVVQLRGRGVSSGGSESGEPETTSPAFPFQSPFIVPIWTETAETVSGTTDEQGRFEVDLSPTTTVSGTLTEGDGGALAGQPFDLTETDEGYEVAVPGFSSVTVPVSTTVTFMGLTSLDLGVIILMQREKEAVLCDCRSLPSQEDCKRRTIRYHIDIPEGCRPSTMSVIDATSAAALWDKTIWSQDWFDSLSPENQRQRIQNESIIGVESGQVYEYTGREAASNTRITIQRRDGNPNEWVLELTSCCHTIPTIRTSVSCPDSEYSLNVYSGLYFDDDDQYVVYSDVHVGGKQLTQENFNSFFGDCSVPYCDVNDRSDPDSLGSNGRLRLQMRPDLSCKLDLSAFRTDLCETLSGEGCYCHIPVLDTRDGSLRGWIYSNRCTPQIVACIEEVLKRHTDCKRVQWIGRQINIVPMT